MVVDLVRLLICVAAAGSLLLWWRWLGRGDRVLATVVAIGFAARAIGGATLFVVSFFGLPIAESLQSGGGFWFFAPDSRHYFEYAAAAAAQGPAEILALSPQLPSVFYIQSLAVVMLLVGVVPSASLLLNLAAYLGTCSLLLVWGRRAAVDPLAVRIAVGAVSFFPSWILWSFQPLKDSLFLLLMVAYAFVVAWWMDEEPRSRIPRATAAFLIVLGALLYAVAAIRWYVAVIMVAATTAAWLVAILQSPGRRLGRLAGVFAFLVVGAVVIPTAAGPYLPEFGQSLFRPRHPGDVVAAPLRMAAYVEEKRLDSAATVADTMISFPGSRHAHSATTVEALRTEASELPLFERLFPRAVAMFLPRFVGSSLGWVEIGGGRGLWALAELDTLFFDALIVLVAWLVVRHHRRGFGVRPIVVHITILTGALAGAICYQTANFGTQFRLRSMVAIGFVLVVFACARLAARTAGAGHESDVEGSAPADAAGSSPDNASTSPDLDPAIVSVYHQERPPTDDQDGGGRRPPRRLASRRQRRQHCTTRIAASASRASFQSSARCVCPRSEGRVDHTLERMIATRPGEQPEAPRGSRFASGSQDQREPGH